MHLPQFLLGQQGMQLDLVDRRDDSGRVDQGLQVFGLEVADADGADAALVTQVGEGLERVDEGVDLGQRPVDEVEVEVVEAERASCCASNALQRRVVPLVGVPQLGDDEDVLARQARARDRVAHLALVAVAAAVSTCR